MYAVIQTGGKQYRVQPGDIIQIEKLDQAKGDAVQFKDVLFVSKPQGDSQSQIWVGKPTVNGASVQGEIVGQGRGEKVLIIKMKRRKQYRRTQGHRQEQTQVLVTLVDNGSGEKKALEASEKTNILKKFHSQLKAKGAAATPKTLGSRKKIAAAKASKAAPAKTEKKAPAKKAAK